jgi:rubrerythrin
MPVMNVMAQVESTIGNFYTACAECFPLNREFWEQLAAEEAGHVHTVRELMRDVSEHPESFEVGDSSPLEALEAFTVRINASFEQLRMGRLTEEKALLAAYLIENTFVEGKYAKIIKLNDASSSKTFEKLSSDSSEHRDRVVKQMRELKIK